MVNIGTEVLELQQLMQQIWQIKVELAERKIELRKACRHPKVLLLIRKDFDSHGLCLQCGTAAEEVKREDLFTTFPVSTMRKFFTPKSPAIYYGLLTQFRDDFPMTTDIENAIESPATDDLLML